MWFARCIVQALRPGQARPTRSARSTRLDRLAFYNTYDARLYLSYLLRRVSHGEEIVIARSGVPVAKLVPYRGEPVRPGLIHLHRRIAFGSRNGDAAEADADRDGS